MKKLPRSFGEVFPQQLEVNGFELLPVFCAHLNQLVALPFHHRDPFDRLLITQAMTDGMTIVARDWDFQNTRRKFCGEISRLSDATKFSVTRRGLPVKSFLFHEKYSIGFRICNDSWPSCR